MKMEKYKPNLDKMMLNDGWKKIIRFNCGKEYVEFHKRDFIIDEEDIIKKGANE